MCKTFKYLALNICLIFHPGKAMSIGVPKLLLIQINYTSY